MNRRPLSLLSSLAIVVAFAPGCIDELDTRRETPKRGSVGEEMFGVVCDRLGAQALREDLGGASFHDVCHRRADGTFADKVDLAKLPALDPAAKNEAGDVVPIELQTATRTKMIGRIESLARRRTELVAAFDATFPAVKVGNRDLDNPDPAATCNARPGASETLLTDQVADMMGRMGSLYHDGTLPQSTESLAKLVDAFQRSQDAQAAWSRLSARQGYRPIETSLGATRPIVAYPRLRELSNTTLRLLSADSNPYEPNPQRDEDGRRIPVPGPGHDAFETFLGAAHGELAGATMDPAPSALVVSTDARTGATVLSRPRETLEMLEDLLFTADPTAVGTPKWIVRRDRAGNAMLAPGMTAAKAPSPFPLSGSADDATRDAAGRAMVGGKLAYDYVDTNATMAARMLYEAKPFVEDGTLMSLLGGLEVAIGPRVPKEKTYPTGTLKYEGVSDTSPLLDLVYALGAVLGDKSSDATLAMAKTLFDTKQPELARALEQVMRALETAKKHGEAKIPADTAIWDDILEIVGKIAAEPGLLEEILYAFGEDSIAKNLGPMFSKFQTFRDDITYDMNDLNGRPWNATTKSKDEPRTPVDRSKPITRDNRSEFLRFLRLISDVSGVTLCNKDKAKLYGIKKIAGVPIAVTLPLSLDGSASYKECEVFKIDDLGVFYLDAIVNAQALPERASEVPRPGLIYVRDKQLRDGLIQIPLYGPLGNAEVGLMEDSSGITGFWTDAKSRDIAPKPEWLNRLAFFDWANDDVNAQTRKHVDGLTGRVLGSSACPERVIDDPLPNEVDAAKDKKVHGLRACAEGQWFQQRNPATIFVWEHFGFYDTMRTLLTPFARHKKERLFLDLASKLYRVYLDSSATADECLLAPGQNCTRQGVVSYEPLLIEILGSELVPAIADLAKALRTVNVKQCTQTDGKGACTEAKDLTGIDVAAAATRAIVDPEVSKANKLTDRHGNVATKRNDGGPVVQVTPAYLLTNALASVDRAYDDYEASHPDDKARRLDYRRGRSALADRFLAVSGGKLANPIVSTLAPKLIDMLRAQLNARCPRSFVPPYERCAWARDELPKKAETTVGGPLAGSGLVMMETIRENAAARKETEQLLAYLLDATSSNDALASTLASVNDALQLFGDDANLVPLYHVLAAATATSVKDERGRIVEKSFLDAQMALLARISGKYLDEQGREVCRKEIDPNQVLAVALKNLVTPIHDDAFKGQSPLEIIVDVVADVNRADPSLPYDGTLQRSDYTSVADNVIDFLTNKERGLEQFYEVIRQGTTP